jgi:hypothetical protein
VGRSGAAHPSTRRAGGYGPCQAHARWCEAHGRAAVDTITWYVLLTSASGSAVHATLGPYATR